jgi:hypothetical protein
MYEWRPAGKFGLYFESISTNGDIALCTPTLAGGNSGFVQRIKRI